MRHLAGAPTRAARQVRLPLLLHRYVQQRTHWCHFRNADALCGNPLLIAIDELVSEGLLDEADMPPKVPVDDVDFVAVAKVKQPLLVKAADRLLNEPKYKYLKDQMAQFRYVVAQSRGV